MRLNTRLIDCIAFVFIDTSKIMTMCPHYPGSRGARRPVSFRACDGPRTCLAFLPWVIGGFNDWFFLLWPCHLDTVYGETVQTWFTGFDLFFIKTSGSKTEKMMLYFTISVMQASLVADC